MIVNVTNKRFYPRAREERDDGEQFTIDGVLVSIRAPVKNATPSHSPHPIPSNVSIRAPVKNATAPRISKNITCIRFYPRAREGRDVSGIDEKTAETLVSIRAPVKNATCPVFLAYAGNLFLSARP